MAFFVLTALIIIDIILLFRTKNGVIGKRETPEKLSNGDENPISLHLENFYFFPVMVEIFDELPEQFQARDVSFKSKVLSGKSKLLNYKIRPVKRGAYLFGALNLFIKSPIGLISRRFIYEADIEVPVYPSFIQLRKFELAAISNRLTAYGIKKIRRIGSSMEFEQIKDYVAGDDFRTINWKASARRNQLMVNQYEDEKSQQVYSVIDKGRIMKMPFEGLSLLDYAINASLVISNIAIKESDKAGLITFSHKVGSIVPASKKANQMKLISETLYNQKTKYLESDFRQLYTFVKRKISQRSLLLLYTNFASFNSLERQIPYLKRIAKSHLLVVIFFDNTELKQIIKQRPKDTEEIYIKTIAEKFNYEKKQIVKELRKNGIQCLLTEPKQLTVNTINKYLELKSRGLI